MATFQPQNMNTQSQAPIRLPLAVTPDNRDNTTGKDAKLVNAFLERVPDGQSCVFKRPGYTATTTVTAAAGNGCYYWESNVYAIFGNTLYKNGVAQGGVISTTGGRYKFISILGATHRLFFHNTTNAYSYEQVGGVVAIANAAALSTTGNVTSGSRIITGIPSTATIQVGAGISSGLGIPSGSYVTSVDTANQVTINVNATATNAATSIVFTLNGMQPSLCPGSAYLDGTTYVLTPGAQIYGSDINLLTAANWKAINFLTAQIEPDGGVALAKQLVYVIAFKEWSTEVFYDAGNAVGSPLAQVQAAKLNQGCRHAGTVAEVEGRLVWVSTTRSGNIDVYEMEALKARPISTPAIQRLLQAADYTGDLFAWGANIGGHELYVLTFVATNLTLVYDFSTRLWSQWTDPSGNYFPFVAATYSTTNQLLLQHISNGTLVTVSQLVFQDAGGTIPVTIVTPNYDGGTRRTKMLGKLDFIADQVASTLSIRSSDDDYTTWSNTRTVDLSRKKPQLPDCGSFVKRALEIKHAANTSLRLYGIEMQIELGEM